MLLAELDEDAKRLGGGQSTAVILSVAASGIIGASVGDSGAITMPAALRQVSVQATATGYLGAVRLESDPLAASPPVHGWPGFFTLYSATTAMQQFGAAFPTNGTRLALVRISTITGGDLAGATATGSPAATALYFDAQGRLEDLHLAERRKRSR